MKKLSVIVVFLCFSIAGLLFASGQDEDPSSEHLLKGLELSGSGDLTGAAGEFQKAAASGDAQTAAAGYYNYGTVQAMMAGQTQDPSEKRSLLEDSYQSLKRAAELHSLPAGQEKLARRNMQVVREEISELPDEQKQEQNNGQNNESGQQDKQRQEQQQGNQEQDGDGDNNTQNGQQGNSPQTPADMLDRQKDLSNRTESGEGSTDDLAGEQKELQKASEAAGLDDAAVNQAKAAEALKKGDREKASDYQKKAEQALSEASDGETGDREAEEILDQEAEYEARKNRLDQTGGIKDVERNW